MLDSDVTLFDALPEHVESAEAVLSTVCRSGAAGDLEVRGVVGCASRGPSQVDAERRRYLARVRDSFPQPGSGLNLLNLLNL